ncbi:hypothetical protein E2C01_027563 [Portunus trituberculatus]|uniref:Uncharacterized protein n=1 Tax=Portunus trituberculatus TaxID=210409 RepID=A0A5B7EJ19_PORTR|nr:hypothetical protein [Portunus trituberculatus]
MSVLWDVACPSVLLRPQESLRGSRTRHFLKLKEMWRRGGGAAGGGSGVGGADKQDTARAPISRTHINHFPRYRPGPDSPPPTPAC